MTINYHDYLFIINEANYYKIFGVAQNADLNLITAKYKKLIKILHPDLNPGLTEDGSKMLNLIFRKITSAFNILRSPEERKKYDQALLLSRRVKDRLLISNQSQSEQSAKNLFYKKVLEIQNLIDQQKYREAVRFLKKYNFMFADLAIYHSFIGMLEEKTGLKKEALWEFKTALRYDQEDQIALKHIKPFKMIDF